MLLLFKKKKLLINIITELVIKKQSPFAVYINVKISVWFTDSIWICSSCWQKTELDHFSMAKESDVHSNSS